MIIRKKNIKNLTKDAQQDKEKNNSNPDLQDAMTQFENVDITNIEFKERLERRRGDRRRGYRRIDERALVSRAQEEARSIKDHARSEGYEEGLNDAKEDILSLKNATKDFLNAKDEVFENFSKDVLELAIAVSEKIIKKEVELHQDILINVVDEVLEKVNSDEQKIKIKVNPSDLEFAQKTLPGLIEKSGIQAKISIMEDENIQMGSCILIASNGVVDANFETQLKIIKKAFGGEGN